VREEGARDKRREDTAKIAQLISGQVNGFSELHEALQLRSFTLKLNTGNEVVGPTSSFPTSTRMKEKLTRLWICFDSRLIA